MKYKLLHTFYGSIVVIVPCSSMVSVALQAGLKEMASISFHNTVEEDRKRKTPDNIAPRTVSVTEA